MSITIKLDATALRALIGDNDEFRLELQRSVTAEVMRNFLMRDADQLARIAQDMMQDVLLTKADPKAWGSKLILNSKAQAEVKEVVEAEARKLLYEQTKLTTETIKAWLTTQLDARVGAAIAQNFEASVQAAIAERLATIKGQL